LPAGRFIAARFHVFDLFLGQLLDDVALRLSNRGEFDPAATAALVDLVAKRLRDRLDVVRLGLMMLGKRLQPD
jgi:hypothetical protein